MTDIVERLRREASYAGTDKDLLNGAAEEIKRQYRDREQGRQYIRELRADNDRLRTELIKIRSVVGTSTEAWHIANRALEPKP